MNATMLDTVTVYQDTSDTGTYWTVVCTLESTNGNG